jgi:uncharacterized repeat protein (TIGR03803 family)
VRLEVTHAFNYYNEGDGTSGLIEGRDGSFYGTTSIAHESYGSVFKISPNGTLTVLHSFMAGLDGYEPGAGLVQGTDGNFYGLARGGAFAHGTIFRVSSDGEFAVLHHFDGSDGGYPSAALIQGRDGQFYGTAC